METDTGASADLCATADFAGPWRDARTSGASLAGEARFSGFIAVAEWRRGEVASLLPEELELGERNGESDLHPVLFVFGSQNNGAIIRGRLSIPLGLSFQEFGLFVPFVRFRGGRHLHVLVAKMFSSHAPVVVVGNQDYGFAKDLAAMHWDPPLFTMRAPEGELLFHAHVATAGEWRRRGGATRPVVDFVHRIFALPVLGRKPEGHFAAAYFDWGFERAAMRAADVALSIDGGWAGADAPRTCYDVSGGSLEVREMMWRLSWPLALLAD